MHQFISGNKLIHNNEMGRNMQQCADKLHLSRPFSRPGVEFLDQYRRLNTQALLISGFWETEETFLALAIADCAVPRILRSSDSCGLFDSHLSSQSKTETVSYVADFLKITFPSQTTTNTITRSDSCPSLN